MLRDEYKEILKHISLERRFQAKELLFTTLKREVEPYQKVLSFASLKSEIDLSLINEYLIKEKKLFLPRVIAMENGAEIRAEIDYDCILVPGLAFDKRGFRLGRGGGHYDKLLAKYENVYTIGVCFNEQIANRDLPIEPHDKQVQKVCAF